MVIAVGGCSVVAVGEVAFLAFFWVVYRVLLFVGFELRLRVFGFFYYLFRVSLVRRVLRYLFFVLIILVFESFLRIFFFRIGRESCVFLLVRIRIFRGEVVRGGRGREGVVFYRVVWEIGCFACDFVETFMGFFR